MCDWVRSVAENCALRRERPCRPKTRKMIVCCAGCQKPITGKFLVTVLERTWHAECVRCSDCGGALTDKCFSREGKLFCKNDFFR